MNGIENILPVINRKGQLGADLFMRVFVSFGGFILSVSSSSILQLF